MLTAFDWLRRSRTGIELLAGLRLLQQDAACFERSQAISGSELIGPTPSALAMPCARCWLYPRWPDSLYCPTCRLIRHEARRLDQLSRHALVVWGYINQVPPALRSSGDFPDLPVLGHYSPDARHFLIMLRQRDLQPWLQEFALYYGPTLKGHLQIFPTVGFNADGLGMGDILCRAIHHEGYFPLDKLRVRFYLHPYHVLRPQEFDREGLLTYSLSEFLGLLDMVVIFRSILRPEEQAILYQILTAADDAEMSFYWGRFSGILSQKGRDLLEAWQVRQWPTRRSKFFYELIEHVNFRPAA